MVQAELTAREESILVKDGDGVDEQQRREEDVAEAEEDHGRDGVGWERERELGVAQPNEMESVVVGVEMLEGAKTDDDDRGQC